MNEDKGFSDFRAKLRKLNMPRLGSFGEFVFVSTVRKIMETSIERLHDNRTDFLINRCPVDVKTTMRNIEKDVCSFNPYAGPRISGIKYAQVEFFKTLARVSLEEIQLCLLNQQEINELWLKWLSRHDSRLPVNENESKKRALEPIENEIKSFFLNHAIEVRIIHRTCQKGFGKESPNNLKPSKIKTNSTTVFISFNDSTISRDNFHKLIAFPDIDAEKFPMLEKVNLHKPKVDLDRLSEKYIFNNIEDLKEHYFERFSKK